MAQKYNTTTIAKGIIAALILLCLIDADYGFYQAMRTLVSFGFAFLTYRYYQTGDKTNAVIYLCLLIVFQPLMKIGLERSIWMVVDIAVIGFIILQIYRELSVKRPHKKVEDGERAIKDIPSSVKRQGSIRINFPDKEKR